MRRLDDFDERPIDGIYRRIQTMFVVRTVIDCFVIVVLVAVIVLVGSLGSQVRETKRSTAALSAEVRALSARGYQSRAVSCIVLHATAPTQALPPQCLDPKVLAQVPAQYRYG